jgi:hypothetical protein
MLNLQLERCLNPHISTLVLPLAESVKRVRFSRL